MTTSKLSAFESGGTKGQLLPSFQELLPNLKTGDLILYGGDSPLCKRLKRITGSRWSHVAMIARLHQDERPLLWEATANSDLEDVLTGKIQPGVQLVDLENWIVHYAGETAIRRLQVDRTKEMESSLIAFFKEVHGRPYELSRLELLKANYDGLFGGNRQEDLSSLFCSELVAAAYQKVGLLAGKPPSNEYTPRDFSNERQPPLTLLRGAHLEDEVIVYGEPGTAG